MDSLPDLWQQNANYSMRRYGDVQIPAILPKVQKANQDLISEILEKTFCFSSVYSSGSGSRISRLYLRLLKYVFLLMAHLKVQLCIRPLI